MRALPIELKLVSDAELGTGLGSVTVDDYVPRDEHGRPFVPASHLKGLLRERLREIGWRLGRRGHLDDEILGGEGVDLDAEGLVRVSDLKLGNEDPDGIHVVSRTALDEFGTARNQSLRSTEAVAVETRFTGTLRLRTGISDFAENCVRLALLSIPAVGGGRTRGSGSCVLEVIGETRSPGAVFMDLLKASHPSIRTRKGNGKAIGSSQSVRCFRVKFQADSSICCPEVPAMADINVIRSGIAVPASAVQGAILHLINDAWPKLAGACFDDSGFRAWPLHPCGDSEAVSVLRSPVTLRLGEDDGMGCALMLDGAIRGCQAVPGKKFRAAGGTLLRGNDGWRLLPDHGIRRMVSTHFAAQAFGGQDVRNLFTVDALAPTQFRGLLALPEQAAEFLEKLIKFNGGIPIHFGKGRGVRGGGCLTLESCEPAQAMELGFGAENMDCLIIQSPVVIGPSSATDSRPLEEIALEVFGEWARVWRLPAPERFWGSAGVRFGWNRHKVKGRSEAKCVILPGSVVRFSGPLAPGDVTKAILGGIGPGRDEGYGAVAVHPGLPVGLHREQHQLIHLGGEGSARAVDPGLMKEIRELSWLPMPSPSQIAAFRVQLLAGPDEAKAYLEHQKERGHRIWRAWKPFYHRLLGEGTNDGLLGRFAPPMLAEGLKTLIDLIQPMEGRP